jgi:TRAP-type mannitol/chloroaromatic compound transport system substrate-binding protein
MTNAQVTKNKMEEKMKSRKILLVHLALALLVGVGLVTIIGCRLLPVELPAPEQPVVIEWILQGFSAPGDPAHVYLMNWIEDIHRMSGGRLRITVHPPGAVVPFMDAFSAVADGILDAAHTAHPFWIGVDPVFGMFCGSATGMTSHEASMWYFERGGKELAARKYAEYNIHAIPFGSLPAETFLWARHPVRTFEDLKGLKVRAGGFSLEMFTRLGITAFLIPGGEISPALLKGIVDAAEYGTFATDMALGFHDAAPYAMIGLRATTMSEALLINMDRWKELPSDLQAIVTIAAHKYMFSTTPRYEKLEMQAVTKAEGYGVTIVHIEEDLAKLVRKTFDELLNEHAAKCPFFAQVLESQRTFLKEYRPFRALIWPWE